MTTPTSSVMFTWRLIVLSATLYPSPPQRGQWSVNGLRRIWGDNENAVLVGSVDSITYYAYVWVEIFAVEKTMCARYMAISCTDMAVFELISM